jgi:hypothetical protein
LAAAAGEAHTAVMDTLTPLICDLLEWLARAPRTHAEVMDGWRTSCPRLPVWEEATDRGYVVRRGRHVEVTPQGRSFLAGQRSLDAEQRTGVNLS